MFVSLLILLVRSNCYHINALVRLYPTYVRYIYIYKYATHAQYIFGSHWTLYV